MRAEGGAWKGLCDPLGQQFSKGHETPSLKIMGVLIKGGIFGLTLRYAHLEPFGVGGIPGSLSFPQVPLGSLMSPLTLTLAQTLASGSLCSVVKGVT